MFRGAYYNYSICIVNWLMLLRICVWLWMLSAACLIPCVYFTWHVAVKRVIDWLNDWVIDWLNFLCTPKEIDWLIELCTPLIPRQSATPEKETVMKAYTDHCCRLCTLTPLVQARWWPTWQKAFYLPGSGGLCCPSCFWSVLTFCCVQFGCFDSCH